jgi:hypothetical protein
MSKRNRSNILSVSARTLLAFVFVFGQSAWAGQNPDPRAKPGSSGKAPSQQSQASLASDESAKAQSVDEEEGTPQSVARENSRGGQHEGIKVHGHWTIEVRNPDGTVVTHREFENSLTSSGALALANILSGVLAFSFWQITLSGGPEPCFESLASAGGPAPSACSVVPKSYNPFPGATSYFQTLTTTKTFSQVTLSGTAVAGESGSVQTVQTFIYLCSTTVAPAGCTQISDVEGFTAATLATPVPVSTGQTIAVTVTISFS